MVAKIVPEERTCLICPNTFLVAGAGNGKREQKYCSVECRTSARFIRRSKTANTLTETEASYLAGMIDADGHVALYKHNTEVLRVHMDVCNTNIDLLYWIKEETGVGSVTRQKAATDRYKAVWNWNCVSGAATSVLEQTLPYMIVKKDRAELALEFHQGLESPVNRADDSWQQSYGDRMRAMNKRGPKETGFKCQDS